MKYLQLAFFIFFLFFLFALAYASHTYDVFMYFSPESVRSLVASFDGLSGWVLYGILYAVATVAFLPATPLTILAGSLFGPVVGLMVVVLSATLGATIAFFIARFFGEGFVGRFLSTYATRVYAYDEKLSESGFLAVLFLRLVPLFPFNGLNFLLGLTKVRARDYFFGTLFGIIPGSFALVYFGNALTMLSLVQILIGIGLILFILLLSIVLKRLFTFGSGEYDLIVVGAGAGGLNVLGFMHKAGFKVLLIEKNSHNVGGDCLNFGCVPSKALIHASRAVHTAHTEARRFGIQVHGDVSMKEVRKHIEGVQNTIRERENVEYFRKQGIEVAVGEAKFCGRNSVVVAGKEYSAKKILLATGSRPRTLIVPGSTLPHVHTNESIFSIEEIPKNLVVIGAGPIGLELGQAFARLGSHVTIVCDGRTILTRNETSVSPIIVQSLKNDGVDFLFEASVKEIDTECVTVTEKGQEKRIEANTVLVAIGRDLSFDALELSSAGIRTDRGKLIIDDYLRTTNKSVYVAGDAVGGPQFTHLTEMHANVLLKNFFIPRPFWRKFTLDNLASVTYTSPEVAVFGKSERELQQENIPYERQEISFNHDDRALIDNENQGYCAIYSGKGGAIFGGTLVCTHAGELVRELIVAHKEGLTLKTLLETVYPYPIRARIIQSLARQTLSKKLTPATRKLLRVLFN